MEHLLLSARSEETEYLKEQKNEMMETLLMEMVAAELVPLRLDTHVIEHLLQSARSEVME
jgi:hypothetical protein